MSIWGQSVKQAHGTHTIFLHKYVMILQKTNNNVIVLHTHHYFANRHYYFVVAHTHTNRYSFLCSKTHKMTHVHICIICSCVEKHTSIQIFLCLRNTHPSKYFDHTFFAPIKNKCHPSHALAIVQYRQIALSNQIDSTINSAMYLQQSTSTDIQHYQNRWTAQSQLLSSS